MRRHWEYFKYVIRHKWFVFLASIKIGSGIFRAIVHDMSKFLPSEWFPYARTFYTSDGQKRYLSSVEFCKAWLLHQHRNPHHWEYWLSKQSDGSVSPIQMPIKYVQEMVADWMGAGRAINGKWDVMSWYEKNSHKMILHPATKAAVKEILDDVRYPLC